MADGKWSEKKEECCHDKTEICHLRRMNTPGEKNFARCYSEKLRHLPKNKSQKNISIQLDIKIGQFTHVEPNSVLGTIKIKAARLEEIPLQVWKTRGIDDILLRYCNAVNNQNTTDRLTKRCILPFPEKIDFGIVKNYGDITLTSKGAKIYSALIHNRIEPKIEKILRKNENGFQRNWSMTSQILTIRKILEAVRANNLEATLLFVDFSKVFDSIHRGEDGANTFRLRTHAISIAAIMILYKNT